MRALKKLVAANHPPFPTINAYSLIRIAAAALVIFVFFFPGSVAHAQSWPNSYSSRRTITIDHGKIPNTDQINFPVLISGTYADVATTSNGGTVTNGSGYDIIFTADPSGLSVLPFEQESYNSTTGAVNYWVQVPTVSHTTDTTIYMFYGNSAVTTDQSNKNGVWDTSYKGVWHLDQTPSGSGSILDSTSNGYNGTPASSGISLSSTGIAGGSLNFDGVSYSNQVTFSSSVPGGPPVTASIWIKTTGLNSTAQSEIMGKYTWSSSGWEFADDGQYGAVIFNRSYPNYSTLVNIPRSSVNNGAWHYLTTTIDTTNVISFYLDGSVYGTATPSSITTDTAASMVIGGLGGNAGGGLLTEARVSNTVRSADWIATEYNNQNSPSTFYSVGGTNAPSITGISPPYGSVGTTVTISGTRFGTTQGTSTITFNGVAATPSSWNSSSISAPVPTGSSSGNVIVTVAGAASNSAWFTLLTGPTITSLSASAGASGTNVTISGAFFGSTQGSSTLTFDGVAASITSWSATSIVAQVPSGAASGYVVVTVSGTPSNGVWFTVPNSVSNGNGYSYWRRIAISHTKVPNTDQINFPVLISGTYAYLATTANGGNVTSSSGYDIIFTSDPAGENVLAFEQESYNATTGAMNYWVQVPTVSHTTDTTIYMFYGNSAVTTDQSNKNGVWDSNYKGVWHLPNGTTLSGADSTASANILSINSATAAAGQMDGAASFNGSSSSLGISSFNLGATNLTVSSWVYSTNFNQNAIIINKETTNSDWNLFFESGHIKLRGGSSSSTVITTGLPSNNAWHNVVGTISGTTGTIYVDGVQQSSGSVAAVANSQNTLDIGRYGDSGGGYYFSGLVDEVEVSNIVRSADWIAAAYSNQSSVSTFYGVGGPNPPTISSLSPTTGTVGTAVTITGTRFGSTQGASTVTFDGATASPTSWSDTSIIVPVPTGAASGNVVVTVSGSASNSVWFTVPSTWTNHFGYERAITISHSKIPNTDQTYFPLLISGTYAYLATTANGGNVTSSNGYDIIFTSDASGTSVLPFEQESYNATTGAVDYWVQVPAVSHTTDTTIYVFYGNSAVTTDQSNKNGVWDSNYKGVWHLDQTPSGSGSILDSTSNGYNGTPASSGISLSSTGIAGGSLNFDGVSISNQVTFSSSVPGGPPVTASIWIKTTGLNSTAQSAIMGKYTWPSSGWQFADDGQYDPNIFNRSYPNYSTLVNIPRSSVNNGVWHYLTTTIDTTNKISVYLDGSVYGTATPSSITTDTTASMAIGGLGGNAGGGLLAEARVSNTVRSADWIAAEYNSASSPGTFYSVGVVNAPTISSVSPSSGVIGTSITIAGSFFGSTQGSSTITFAGVAATPTSWGDTSITVPVPTGATSGNVIVTVSSVASNSVWFTVLGSSANGYLYRRTITISHSKVPNTDQTNFPLLILGTYPYLASSANGGNVTNSNGYDIVFSSDSAGTSLLPFEQKGYNATTGAMDYWVQVPTVSHTTDTTIYMFYGNSAVTTDQSNKNGVWDSNYKGVWHLDQTPSGSGSILDSTSNGYNGTPASSGISLSSTGIAGGSLNFNGVSSSNPVTFSSSVPGGPPVTASIWIKTTGLNSTAQSEIMCKCQFASGGWEFADDGQYDPNIFNRSYPNYSTLVNIPRSLVNNGAWHYLTSTIDATKKISFYLDGSLYGTATPSSITSDTTHSLVIGSFGGNAGGGLLAEARVSSTVRSADWIATEYNSESSPSTFYSVSSSADIGGPVISTISPTTGTASTSVSITGAGFGSTQGTSTVKFNGTSATPSSWSSSSIAAPVPSGATTGNLVVIVSGMASNPVAFTVSGTLSGTVTRQSDGTAVSGATVQVLQNRTVAATATTASNGSYTISSLVTGEYDVQFSASGFGSMLQSAVTIPATGTTLNQALATAGTISGQITQSNGTTAISGATITALQSSEIVGTTTSNGSGNYSISNLSAGSYEVEVSASGYVNQGLTGVSVTSGNTTTENFSLNAVGTQPISYVYDQLGRLTAAIDQGGNVAGYAYDAVGNILSISRGSAQQLSVITFSPGSGSVGTTVTIYGTAFSTTPSQNTVKFNGTTATVTSAAVTSLVVTVPSGATTGTVSVTTSAGTATSTASFTVTTSGAGQPTISSFTPSIGTPGTSVSVSGTNFETVSANDKLKFNVAQSRTSSATTTSLTVSVPAQATSGHLVVATPAGAATSAGDFFVPPGTFTASSVGYTNRVSLGGSLTVTISTANNIGLVVFDGTAGHRISLLTSSNTMTSTGGATTISINSPNGSSLVSQSVTTSAPFIGAQTLSITGTYTIVVQPSGGATGSITLALYDVPADVTGSVTIGGSSVPVTIATPGQGGLLSFSGTSGQYVTVSASSNGIGTVTITLQNSSHGTVTSQTSSSSSFNLSSVALPGTGTSYVAIAPSQGNTGSVTIQLTSP